MSDSMSRSSDRLRSPGEGPRQARPKTQETTMPKYLLLKHYRGGPAPQRPVPPMDQWAPEDVEAQMAFLKHSRAGLSRASTTQRAARGERRVRRRTGAHAGAHLGALRRERLCVDVLAVLLEQLAE